MLDIALNEAFNILSDVSPSLIYLSYVQEKRWNFILFFIFKFFIYYFFLVVDQHFCQFWLSLSRIYRHQMGG